MLTVIGVALLMVGSFSIFGIFAIISSTIITLTPWWKRSFKRNQHRINASASNKVLNNNNPSNVKTFSDTRTIQIIMKVIELLSISHSNASENKSSEAENDVVQNVPLRFQPERRYGSTTTHHRDNLTDKKTVSKQRKSFCSLLSPEANNDSNTIMARRPSGSLFPYHVDTQNPDEKIPNLPRIRSEHSLAKSANGLTTSNISIKLELVEGEMSAAKKARKGQDKEAIDKDSSPTMGLDRGNIKISPEVNRERKNSKSERPKSKSRRASLSSVVSTFGGGRNQELESGLSNLAGMIDFQTSFLVEKEIALEKKVPPAPVRNPIDLPGGSLAISLRHEDRVLKVKVAKIVHLPVFTPWTQHNIVSLKIKVLHNSLTLSEQLILPTKLAIGCIEFGKNLSPAVVEFHLAEKYVQPDQLSKLMLRFEVYEKNKGQSEETLVASLEDTLDNFKMMHKTSNWNKIGMKKILWHSLRPEDCVKVLTGDALVSLCQADREGLIHINISELRNLKFSDATFDFASLPRENINVKLKLRVCIMHNSRIIRVKKGFELVKPLASFIPKVSSGGKAGNKFTTFPITSGNDGASGKHALHQDSLSNMIHFNLSSLSNKIGSSSNHQIVIFLSTSFEYQSRQNETKTFKAIGRVIIANQSLIMNNIVTESSQQLLKEANLHVGSRVYHWLSIE